MNITGFKILFILLIFFQLSLVLAETKPLPLLVDNKADFSVLEHLQNLSSDQFAGRKFSSQGSIQSQSYLVSVLKAMAIPAFNDRYRHSFEQSGFFQTKQGTNIIAYIPGTHHADEFIMLSAHYDHLGTKQNKIYNGADDNASGMAALLHYAKLLKQKPLKHSVILLFTDGEEVNLLGAKAFVAEQKKLLSKIKLNINLDMIAGSKRTKRLRFINKDLAQILSAQALVDFNHYQGHLKNTSNVHLTAGFRGMKSAGSSLNRTNWRMASDHGVFSKAGIAFIYFGVGTHKNYHSEFDDYAHINQRFYLAAVDVIFQQLTYLDGAIHK